MKSKSIRLFFMTTLCLLAACQPVATSSPTPTGNPPTEPLPQETAAIPTLQPTTPASIEVDPFEINKRLGRGVNLGNALEAPNEGEWGVTLKEEYFQLIKNAGFNAVRLPVRWSSHAGKDAPYIIDAAFFERVDWAIEHALTLGLLVVLDMHHYEEMFTTPNQHKERFLALWKQIAEHYRDYPNELLFEPLNEPNNGLTPYGWNKLIGEVIPVIRASNPYRTLVIGPGDWNGIYSLVDLKLPETDHHIIATVHYYSPFEFTHQGAEWVDGSTAWLGTTWEGSSTQKQFIELDLKTASLWAEKNKRPIYLGEFGSYNKADIDSRSRWTTFVTRTAESLGISWSYWEFCAGFGIYDPNLKIFNQSLLKALIP